MSIKRITLHIADLQQAILLFSKTWGERVEKKKYIYIFLRWSFPLDVLMQTDTCFIMKGIQSYRNIILSSILPSVPDLTACFYWLRRC